MTLLTRYTNESAGSSMVNALASQIRAFVTVICYAQNQTAVYVLGRRVK